MTFLIELSGSAKGCAVVPTCGRSYTSKKGDEYFVDLDLIDNTGCDGFLRIESGHDLFVDRIAFGMETYVQVEKLYPWSKHKLVSNVPIKEYCRIGYFKAFYRVVKGWLL